MNKGFAVLLALFIGATAGAGTVHAMYEVEEKKAAQEETLPDEEVKDGAVVNTGEENGVALTMQKLDVAQYATNGVPENADSAYTLTATVNADAKNKRVSWSVAWKDSKSEWATGKMVTDYVTVTPETDGGLTATATCLQDFGEQIIITVASETNLKIKATCTVDYTKKIKSVDSFTSYKGDYWERDPTINNRTGIMTVGFMGAKAIQFSYDSNPATTMTHVYTGTEYYTHYTIDDTFTYEYQLKFDAALGCEELPLKEGATEWMPFPKYNLRHRIYAAPLTYAVAYENEEEIVKQYSCMYGAVIEGCAYGAIGQAYQAKMESLSGQTGLMYMRVLYTGTYSTYSYEMEVQMDMSNIPVALLELNQNGLIF